MTKTICIANQKGGIGKTTTTVNLAGALSRKGSKILVADLDPQGSASKTLSDITFQETIYHIFSGQNITPLQTKNQNIYLLPADKNLSSITPKMVTDYDVLFKLKDYLKNVNYKGVDEETRKRMLFPFEYDFILIDTPPTLLNLTLAGMIAADYLLIPVSTQYYSLQGTNDLIASYQKVQQRLNENLKLLGACISMHDKRTALANEVLQEIKNHFNGNLFQSIIPKTIKIEEAQVNCSTITDLYPESKVSKQYLNLADEIIRRAI